MINFGLQWSLQNTTNCHVLSVYEKHKCDEKHPMLAQMLWLTLSIGSENSIHKKLNHQQSTHFLTMIPLLQEASPQILAFVVLRMHGRLGLEEPLDDPIVAVLGCKVQRCFASGAAAQGQPRRQNRNERKWKNTLRKCWRLKSQSFGNVSTLKIPLDLRNIKVLRCLEAIELFKKMKKPCQPRRQPGCACMLNVEISSQGNFLECWMNVEISRHIQTYLANR